MFPSVKKTREKQSQREIYACGGPIGRETSSVAAATKGVTNVYCP